MVVMEMQGDFQVYVPFTKIDHERRLVYGVMTSETVDEQGEVVDWEATKAALSEWAGNIREMHQPKAVGKRVRVDLDEANKQAYLLAYISRGAEDTWQKIKEGVLTGFSIGGKKLETRQEVVKSNGQEKPVTRVTKYRLHEVSLVDNPANPDCRLEIVKMVDGVPTQTEVVEDPPLANAWYKAGAIVATRPGEDEELEKLLADSGFRKVATVTRYTSEDVAKALEAELPCPKCGKTDWETAWRPTGATFLCKACGTRFEVGLSGGEGMAKGRGEGQGVGGPRQGDGGADKCVCPECGYEEPHEKGVPCSTKTCPKCGVQMVGADEAPGEDEAGSDEGDEGLEAAARAEDLVKADTWLPKGIKQTDLWDSDFLAIHEDYKSGKRKDKSLRKLPIAVHGRVDPRGWMAAYKALKGARGGVKLGPGWPSKEELLRRLEARRPKRYIKKNPNGTYSFTEAYYKKYGRRARKMLDGSQEDGRLEVVWVKRRAAIGGSDMQKFAVIPEDALVTIKLSDGKEILAIEEGTEGISVPAPDIGTIEKMFTSGDMAKAAGVATDDREVEELRKQVADLKRQTDELLQKLREPRPRPPVLEVRRSARVGGDDLQKQAKSGDELQKTVEAIAGTDATVADAVETVKGWVATGQMTPEREQLRKKLFEQLVGQKFGSPEGAGQ